MPEEKPNCQTPDDSRDQHVEQVPGDRALEEWHEATCTISEREEPGCGGKRGAQGEGYTLGTDVPGSDGAQQHDGIQVGVRVEQAEAQGGESGGTRRGRGRWSGEIVGCAAQGGAQGPEPEPEQEGRPSPSGQGPQDWVGSDEATQAEGAEGDQQDVAERTDESDDEGVLALKPGTEHEGVLRADSDDQTEADEQPFEDSVHWLSIGRRLDRSTCLTAATSSVMLQAADTGPGISR